MALVDILLPAFNAEATIGEALDSLLAQDMPDLRIIVVDDGSTDDTAALVSAMAARDNRIHLLSTPNRGIVDALNTALEAADAPYIARHDADDIAFPNRLSCQLAYLDAHTDCIAVGANAIHIDTDGKRLPTRTNFIGDVTPNAALVPAREPYLLHPMLLARREAFAAVGGYRHAFHAEDSDLYWRLLDHGRLHNLPDVLGAYRLHDASLSGRSALNGRISAANSQLAALSYRRRQAGRPDITFPPDRLAAYEAGGSFTAILSIAVQQLDAAERAHLEIAMAAKLLALAHLRAYPLDHEDIRAIQQAIKAHSAHLCPLSRRFLDESRMRTAVSLLRQNRWKDAQILALDSRTPITFTDWAIRATWRAARSRLTR